MVVPSEIATSQLASQCVAAIEAHGGQTKVIDVGPDCDRETLGALLTILIAMWGVLRVWFLLWASIRLSSLSRRCTNIELSAGFRRRRVVCSIVVFDAGRCLVGADDLLRCPSEAMVWGLGRVVGLEDSRRWVGWWICGDHYRSMLVAFVQPAGREYDGRSICD